MRNSIEIDGKSSRDFGLWMDRLPLWPMAAETVDTMSLPGVAVDAGRPTGRYPDYSLTLTGYLTKRPCSDLLSRLSTWMTQGARLVMSTQPDRYGIIRSVGHIAPTRIGTRANEIKIPLTMRPFVYARQERAVTYTASPVSLHGYGNVYSEPLYRLTLASSADSTSLTVNGVTLTIDQSIVSDGTDLVVDIERRIIYTEAGGVLTSVQSKTSGAFWRMVLIPGYNAISWAGGITSVEITPRTRWL